MKIVVIGGTGLIGSKLVNNLRKRGHEAVAASPATGVNTLTGEGLAGVLSGADVVVDVANSPSFEDQAVLAFFETSGRNLLAAEAVADVKHHVALSIVGTDRVPDSGYLRAKAVQEHLVEASKIPFTIVRSTQFFEFLGGMAQAGTNGSTVHLSPALFQPIAADDVAAALTEVILAPPVNGILEIAGPERVSMAEMVQRFLRANHDQRSVVADPQVRYFGAQLSDRSLVPGDGARIEPTRFEDWIGKAA